VESFVATDWDRTVAEHGPTILRLACRILGRGPDAEDAVQDAFLQVYQIAQRDTLNNCVGLLRRAVVHRSLDRLRRRRPNVVPAGELPGREDDPQEVAAARELGDRLRDAVARLPTQQGAAFCLRYFDDQPYEQIAANLGIAVGAVATALHKARSKLKTMLGVSIQED
jgi:RNA polymerase sigma-70 factor, ECF subfamily